VSPSSGNCKLFSYNYFNRNIQGWLLYFFNCKSWHMTNLKPFQNGTCHKYLICKYSKNPQLRPSSGLDQSGLNCGVVLIVNILIAYTLYDHGLF
jgi:hypothetical protein